MSNVPPELLCLKCCALLTDSVGLSCGHSVCLQCSNSTSLTCPHCHTNVSIAIHDNKNISSLASTYRVPPETPIDKCLPKINHFYASTEFVLKETSTATLRQKLLEIDGYSVQTCIYPHHIHDRHYIAISVQLRPIESMSSKASRQMNDCSRLNTLYKSFERERITSQPVQPFATYNNTQIHSPPTKSVRLIARLINVKDKAKSVQVNEYYDFPRGTEEGLFIPLGPRENVFDSSYGFSNDNNEVKFSIEIFLDDIVLTPSFFPFCSATETLSLHELRALGVIQSIIAKPSRTNVDEFSEAVCTFLDLQSASSQEIDADGSISPSMLLLICILRKAQLSNFRCEEEDSYLIDISSMICQTVPYIPLLGFIMSFAKANIDNDGFEIIEPLITASTSKAIKTLLGDDTNQVLASKTISHSMVLSTQKGIRILSPNEFGEAASQKINDLFPDFATHFSGKVTESEDLSSLDFDVYDEPKAKLVRMSDPWKLKYLRLVDRHNAEVTFLEDEYQRNIRSEQQRTAKAIIEKTQYEEEIKKLTQQVSEDRIRNKEISTENGVMKQSIMFLESIIEEKNNSIQLYQDIFNKANIESKQTKNVLQEIVNVINKKSI